MPIFSNVLAGAAGQGGAADYVIPRSLRFDETSSAYLHRTPSSASNRTTWSFSCWYKRGKIGHYNQLFNASTASNNYTQVYIESDDTFVIASNSPSAGNRYYVSERLLRDPSAWYHLVAVFDTTNSTEADRMRLYVNGERLTNFSLSNAIGQNVEGNINSTNQHSIGSVQPLGTNGRLDGLMADIQFVDGQALTADDFGETRSSDGVWVPKKFDGVYGTNGFHLNFSDSSTNEALGFDSAATVPDLDPKKGMDVVTYSGNSTIHNIGGLAFEPGLVWLKTRTGHSNKTHGLFDVVRGPTKFLASNSTAAENSSYDNNLTAFNPDGFRLEEEPDFNTSGRTYVGWCWAAGGPAVSNTNGSITSQVSANIDYGFSIVKWTATNGYGTIGHGLTNQTPKFILVKSLASANWAVFHTSLGNTKGLNLNLNGTGTTAQELWNNTSPTTSLFSVGEFTNYQTADHIAYVWSEVSNYSKFGTYEGASTVTVTTGFKPRWILLKNVDASGSWSIFDSERDSDLEINHRIYANETSAEGTNIVIGNFTDTGFTLTNQGNSNWNTTGDSFVYAAFADRPGNHWDVNNIVTNEGLTTSKTQFDIVTYTGNGGAQAIGQPVYSNETTGGNNTSNMFDGSGSSWNNLTAGNTITFTPSRAIACTQLEIWVDTDTPIRVNVNGGGYGSTFTQSGLGYVDITPGGGITSLTSLLIDAPSGGGGSGAGIRGLRINGTTIVVDGDGGPGLKFQPDFVWLKSRSAADSHSLFDSVRGAPKGLHSNTSGAEFNDSSTLTAFNSDGFRLAGHAVTNANNQNYVAWCWKAGGAAVSNTDGSITSSVSAGNGFSIVSYTGTGSAATVGHGLSSPLSLVIVKQRNGTDSWAVYSRPNGASGYLSIEDNTGLNTSVSPWNSTDPTSSVFSIAAAPGNNAINRVNLSGKDYVAYCFCNVPQRQRVGQYIGNGSGTGPVIVTGFKVRFLLVKRTDGDGSWVMLDSERNPTNPRTKSIYAEVADAEYQPGQSWADFDENSFQPRATYGDINASGGTYIYLAIGDDEIGSDEDCFVDVPNAVAADADATDATGGYQRGNYATINPLAKPDTQSVTLSNGNLKFVSGAASGNYATRFATIGMTTGKWYAEFRVNATANGVFIGIAGDPNSVSNFIGSTAASAGYLNDGRKANNNSLPSYANSYGAGDVIGIAFDADAGSLVFYQNGVSQGEAYSGLTSGPYFMGISGTTNVDVDCNFGQQRFKYGLPYGYAALNTTALPAATITNPSEYFDTSLWTGNGSNQSITGLEFSPDLVWIKMRSAAAGHRLYDAVRGATKYLVPQGTDAEATQSAGLTSFDSAGFSLGSNFDHNNNNSTFVGWAWDAGSSTVSNTDGSITSNVRASAASGFSIVSWTGTGANGSIGHGLNSKPQIVITQNRTDASSWVVDVIGVLSSGTDYLLLNSTQSSGSGGSTADNSVVNILSFNDRNGNGDAMIAYCFTSVAGYSAFSSFEANGSTDGPFVYLGFRPRFLMIKNATDTTHATSYSWVMIDTARYPDNRSAGNLNPLYANNAAAENLYGTGSGAATGLALDVLSNGFKVRSGNAELNFSGTYVYAAFAENPFQANGGLAR